MSEIELMPEPPPIDYDNSVPPSDESYFMPYDTFPEDLFADILQDYDVPSSSSPWLAEGENVVPGDAKQILDALMSQNRVERFEQPEPNSEEWGWHDARLIGVEREADESTHFEIGAINLYTNLHTGDLGGTYLPIAEFEDVDVAAAFFNNLQERIHDQGLAAYQVPEFAESQSVTMNSQPEAWRSAMPDEYAAYEQMRDMEAGIIDDRNEPPNQTIDQLIQTAIELGGVPAQQVEDQSARQALNAIGIEANSFSPVEDPPPFYDSETGTAYWIGVFQSDKNDRDNCVTSILSLGRNPETGEMEAQLAPCVPGEWDKAYNAAEYLIEVAQKGGIEHCFDTAEGMALATDQRESWEQERGVTLKADTTKEIADYTRDNWEIEL